jgi:predicted nucleic acid-binding protein
MLTSALPMTVNTKDFARFKDLTVENWSRRHVRG